MRFKVDNRLKAFKRSMRCARGLPLYLDTESRHYRLNYRGKRYLFCYIPKNASSSILWLLFNLSSHRINDNVEKENIDKLMKQHHLVRSLRDLKKIDASFLFVRNPYTRVVSTFVNKFVVRLGNDSIFRDYYSCTGLDPKDATFSDFVERYLAQSTDPVSGNICKARNRHIYTQLQQLLPIDYTEVSDTSEFDRIVSRYFPNVTPPRKNSRPASSSSITNACLVPSSMLHDAFLRDQEVPSYSAFEGNELRSLISDIYEKDFRFFKEIFAH